MPSREFLLSEHAGIEHDELVIDVTVARVCSPSALDASIDVVGFALAKDISRKRRHYRENTHKMYKLVLVAFSIYAEYGVDVRRVLKDLANHWV